MWSVPPETWDGRVERADECKFVVRMCLQSWTASKLNVIDYVAVVFYRESPVSISGV